MEINENKMKINLKSKREKREIKEIKEIKEKEERKPSLKGRHAAQKELFPTFSICLFLSSPPLLDLL